MPRFILTTAFVVLLIATVAEASLTPPPPEERKGVNTVRGALGEEPEELQEERLLQTKRASSS